MSFNGIDALLAPKSIAVVGASGNQTRIGGRPLYYLAKFGYAGKVYAVNPKYKELQGFPCVADVASLPEPVDLAVICLGASEVIPTIEACVARGIRSAVVFASEFAEGGPEGKRRQAELTALAKRTGIRIVGPNTGGLRDLKHAVFGSFSTDVDSGVKSGRLAVVSQSGGIGVYFGAALPRLGGFGTRFFVDTGNEADVESYEMVDYISQDPEISAIGLVVEGCKDGRVFVEALQRARARGKTVVVLKIGRSELGAKAAASHTGALASEDTVWDAGLAAAGAIRVRDEVEFYDVLTLFGIDRQPAGNRLGLMSLSGGVATMMLDACSDFGIEVPEFDLPPLELRQGLPSTTAANPLDVSANVANNPDLTGPLILHTLNQGNVDALVFWLAFLPMSPLLGPVLVEQLIEASKKSNKPIYVTGLASPDMQERLMEAGIPVYTYPSRLLKALSIVANAPKPVQVASIPKLTQVDDAAQTRVVTGLKAVRALTGLPFAPIHAVDSADRAVLMAIELGYPVVMKAEADGIAHKSDLGLVRVGLHNAAEVRAAFDGLTEALARTGAPGEIVIQPLVRGTECFAGLKIDPVFGPAVTFGMGGVLVEYLKDVATLLAPTTAELVLGSLQKLKGYPLLTGVRGEAPRDIAAFAEAVANLSRVTLANPAIREVDLNPIIVGPRGAVAVDAVVVQIAQ